MNRLVVLIFLVSSTLTHAQTANWKRMEPIKLDEIKEMGRRYSTATILNNSRTEFFKRYSSNGFYGNYTIVLEQIKKGKSISSYAGELVIFNTIKPWSYERAGDQFVEIFVVNDKVKIFDFLRVGLAKSQVLDFLGTPYLIKNDLILFEGDDGLFVSVLCKDKRVEKIKVGRYNQEIPKSKLIDYLSVL